MVRQAPVQPTRPSKSSTGQTIPGEEGYDKEYLTRVRDLVRECASEGLHVLISAHQDLYSERFCGNGMPTWTITSDKSTMAFPRPVYGFSAAKYDGKDGPPIDETCKNMDDDKALDDWGRLYISDAVTRAFWGLYTNDNGIRDDFVAAWRKFALTLTDEPNILGYELINEPFIAARTWYWSIYGFLLSSQHAVTESDFLQPLYTQVHDAIREVDKRSLIFYEPVTGNAGGDGFKSEGFLSRSNASKTVMAYHVYGWNIVNRRMVNEEGQMKKRAMQVKPLGSSAMITEWDVEYGKDGRRLDPILQAMELADSNLVSWIGWQYKEFIRITGSPPTGSLLDPISGFLRPSMAHLFSRPYAEAVAGTLLKMHYEEVSKTFSMTYVSNGASGETGTTVVRVSEEPWSYDSGYDVLLKAEEDSHASNAAGPSVKWTKLPGGRIGLESPDNAGIEVTLRLFPK